MMTERIRIALPLLVALVVGFDAQGARGYLSRDAARAGKDLADIYCGTCHLVPPPGVLDRVSWERQVLPWMACLLGVHDRFYTEEKLQAARDAGYAWPEAPLHPNEFNAIAAYYQLKSPIALYKTNAAAVIFPATSGFRLLESAVNPTNYPAATLVSIREDGMGSIVGTELPARLVWRNRHDGRETIIHEGSIPVSACLTEQGMYFGDVGSVTPSFEPVGKLYFAPRKGDSFGPAEVLIEDLPRIAHVNRADLNRDGIEDLVICAFGWFEGSLFWLEGLPDGGFRRHDIFNRPGAVKSVVNDLNGDGHPDLVVMMAQALETIYFLYNDGKGGFSGDAMVTQHPAFGYSDFELVDMDGDGGLEVVTVNGDFDYEGSARPYQGVRIYVRKGDRLEERYFFSMPGSYNLEAEDFDGDGDVDLAVVSFTPGLGVIRTPRSLFLENLGGFKMRPWELPHDSMSRWFIADAGDYDGDGDPDLMLGALYNAPGGSAPSNIDVTVSFGVIPFDTILLENVFSENQESLLADRFTKMTRRANWGRFRRLFNR